MNTDKTLRSKFTERINDHPIWYYKELQPIEITYVMWNLLKETFVVEIDGSKHEITFGKNRKHEIGTNIKYDDIKNSKLCSFEVVEKGFREGQWFIITDIDTTDDFKLEYEKRKKDHEEKEAKEIYKSMLRNGIENMSGLTQEERNRYLLDIENFTYEELEDYVFRIVKKEYERK